MYIQIHKLVLWCEGYALEVFFIFLWKKALRLCCVALFSECPGLS